MSLDSLTWKCHVCGEERPDDKISVFSKPIYLPDGRSCGEHNIRFCNDKKRCIEGADKIDLLKR